ncbi:MAG: sulfurtransferase [Rhodobacteraceae bacterium]|nr:sulfurtransferase [Paracoccaceae bacterium]
MKAESMKEMIIAARAEIFAAKPHDAYEGLQNGGLLLDVREAEEVAEAQVPGALCVPRGLLESRADPESGSSRPELVRQRGNGRVYVLCASGARATLAAHTLTRMGYEASVIEGGMEAWKDASLPIGR